MATSKSGERSSALIELVLGVLIILLGTLKPKFLWDQSFVQSFKGPLGDKLFGILIVVAGVLLSAWSLFKLARSFRSSET